MGKLINKISGSRLLISGLPDSALRTHVESLGKPRDVNRGKFNNASALGRSLYWCQALHIMNKDRYQSTSARRALALLNSPQVFSKHCLVNVISKDTYLVFSIYWSCPMTF